MNYENPSEVDHVEILLPLLKARAPELYIEFGIQSGACIFAFAPYCRRAIGVDIAPGFPDGTKGINIYSMTTDEFARSVLPGLPEVEFAFVDASHEAEQVVRDATALYRYLAVDGIIAVHDTYPKDYAHTNAVNSGDAWKAPAKIKAALPGAEILTFPVPHGLTFIRKPTALPVWWMTA